MSSDTNTASLKEQEDEDREEKPKIESKTSMEILSELFGTFDAEPPVIVKKEKKDKEDTKKHKKSKKKHKHKDKKHKKKAKKKKKSSETSSSSSDENQAIDMSDILIKTETGGFSDSLANTLQKIIKVEELLKDTDTQIKNEIKQEDVKQEKHSKHRKEIKEGELKEESEITQNGETKGAIKTRNKIVIKDLRHTLINKAKKSEGKKSLKRKKITSETNYEDEIEEVKALMKRSRRSRSKSKEKEREKSKPSRIRDKEREKEKDSRHRDREKDSDRTERHKDKDDFYAKYDKYRERGERDDDRDHRQKSRHNWREDRLDERYREERHDSRHNDDFYKASERFDERRSNNRYKGYDRDNRHRTNSNSSESRIDKKKLLEIARKNAIQMMKNGNLPAALALGPQAQEKVIAAISGGGKTIEELTDFCKTLSKKEELGELSSVTEESESDEDMTNIRHPFQINKDRPLTINIKNSVPLPTRTNQERASELRIQFPVSSGQHHRKGEQWVPVSPKKIEAAPTPVPAVSKAVVPIPLPVPQPVPAPVPPPATIPAIPFVPVDPSVVVVPPMKQHPVLLAIEAPTAPIVVPAPVDAPPGPQLLPVAIPGATGMNGPTEKEIACIVTQRLAAMRKLQENPNDMQAIAEMYKAQKGMNTWAESKQLLGQFTGSTGVQILSQAELSSGYQAWARKDQLQTAAPVSGGMGMHLLQKMGWKPGEGLGKEKSGTLEPLLLEVKLDKKGVSAKEEGKRKQAVKIAKQTVKTLQGKHPVSLLYEYASKRKLGAPAYMLDFECGPDHMKNFLFKVVLNGVEYKPNVASGNKKDAKAHAATLCLQTLGLLSS